MNINITHTCPDYDSYRAMCVKALFNVDHGHTATITAVLPLDERDWTIGAIVGPSGTGKTTIGQAIWGPETLHQPSPWPENKPIIDAVAPGQSFNTATTALSAAGLSTIPAWLRPYHTLSTGEKFRADLARIIGHSPVNLVLDEFTSVIDRRTAKSGAHSFARAWRKTGGRLIVITCHEDILDWLCPDWTYHTRTGFAWRNCLTPPSVDFEIRRTNWDYWPAFEQYHYLKLPRPIAAYPYVAFVDDQPIAHLAMTTRPGLVEGRAMRFVVTPEWQGIGIGIRLLESIALMWRMGDNPYNRPMPTLINTSHPGLARALRHRPGWYQVSANFYGDNKIRSVTALNNSTWAKKKNGQSSGFGGHFRPTQGFRFLGE